MGNGISTQDYLVSSPGSVTTITNDLKIDVVGSLKSFNEELVTLLQQFADENSPIVIDGIEYSAQEKQTAGVQLLLQNKLEKIENVQSTLLNIINILFQLDKSAGQIGSGG